MEEDGRIKGDELLGRMKDKGKVRKEREGWRREVMMDKRGKNGRER